MFIKMSESSGVVYLFVIFYSIGNVAVENEAANKIHFQMAKCSDYAFKCTNSNKSYNIEENHQVSVHVSSDQNLTVEGCLMNNMKLNYSTPSYNDSFQIDFQIYNVSKKNGVISCSFLNVGETSMKRKLLCSVPLLFKDADNIPDSKSITHTVSYYLIPNSKNESLLETFEDTLMAYVECHCEKSEANVTYEDCELQLKGEIDSSLSITRLYVRNSSNESYKCSRKNGLETVTLNIGETLKSRMGTEDNSSTHNDLSNNPMTWIIVVSVFCLCLVTTIGYFVTKRIWKQCRERAAARLKRNQVASDGSRPRLPTPIYEQPYDIYTGYEDRIRRLKVSILLGKDNSGRLASSSDSVPSGSNKKLTKKPRSPPPLVTYRPRIPTPPRNQVPQ